MKYWAVAALSIGVLGAADGQAENSRAAGLKGNPGQFFGTDDYPPEAIRASEQGRVVAKLWIDPSGRVVSCTVLQTSGSVSLDQATCRIALDKVSFVPATDRRGRPVAATYTLPVRWVLPTGGMTITAIDTLVEMTVSIDDQGEVLACNHRAVPPLAVQFDPCREFPVGKVGDIRWKRDDRPVGGTMRRTYIQRVTLDP